MRRVLLRLGPRDGDELALPDASVCVRYAFVEVDMIGSEAGRPRRVDSPPLSYRPTRPPITRADGCEVWLLSSD